MSQAQVLFLCVGALILALIAVVIDRLNFPQRKFHPKSVVVTPDEDGSYRDRTGAHILDLDPDPDPELESDSPEELQ